MAAKSGVRFGDIPGLSPETLDVLAAHGFVQATPVQEVTIPLFLNNKDVAVDASTGSGKTLAFVVPMVEMLRRLGEPLKRAQAGALILSPTRELARQICDVATPFVATLAKYNCALLVGGRDVADDLQELRQHGAQVIIGTPGRVKDVLDRMAAGLDLKTLEVLVLDEADRLLDMGFQRDIDAIMQCLPKQRRTGLFSATQTEAVQALARAGLRNPVRVNVAVQSRSPAGAGAPDTQRTPERLTAGYVVCREDDKLPVFLGFLRKHGSTHKCIAYVLSCASVEYLASVLPEFQSEAGGASLWTLHGKMKQRQREAALDEFTAAPHGCLLCTDVAARGLDVPDVHWVLQLDPPQDPNAFVHRVGRTARMGREGKAVSLLLPQEAAQYPAFLAVRRVPVQEMSLESVADMDWARPADAMDGASGETSTSARGAAAVLDAATLSLRSRLRGLSETDREVMEKGTRAFVSYLRGYKEHQCKFIFRLADLDLSRLAYAFGLLRLPRMPEVKKARGEGFVPSEVDPDTVRFRDKARERQRVQGAAQRDERRAQERAKRQAKAAVASQASALQKLPQAKRKKLSAMQDEQDLEDDYRLLTKAKRGKISEAELDEAMGVNSDKEEEEVVKAKDDLVTKAMKKRLKKKRRQAMAKRSATEAP